MSLICSYGNPYDEGEEGGNGDAENLHNGDTPQFDENGQLIIYRGALYHFLDVFTTRSLAADNGRPRDDGGNEDDDAMEM